MKYLTETQNRRSSSSQIVESLKTVYYIPCKLHRLLSLFYNIIYEHPIGVCYITLREC